MVLTWSAGLAANCPSRRARILTELCGSGAMVLRDQGRWGRAGGKTLAEGEDSGQGCSARNFCTMGAQIGIASG